MQIHHQVAEQTSDSEHAGWSHPGDEHVPHGPKNILHVSRSVETIARLTEIDAETIYFGIEYLQFNQQERKTFMT